MGAEAAENLLWDIARWAAEEGRRDPITVLWHGGEPLLMGKAFFRRMLRSTEAIAQMLQVRLDHAMQSNLLAVDAEWAALLAELLSRRRIGTSYDPLPGIRVARGGTDYDVVWRQAVRLLRQRGVRVGIVWVVHRQHLSDPEGCYRQFRALEHGGGVRVNPIYAAGRGARRPELHLSSAEWGDFLWALYRAWKASGEALPIDPFRGWDALAAGRPARLACSLSGACTRGFTGIRADGVVYSCGRSLDEDLAPFGRLGPADLAGVLRSPNRAALLHRARWLRMADCSDCPWWAFCHGGCPNDAFLASGDPLAPTPWCEGYRAFFSRAYGRRTGGVATQPPADGGYLFGSDVASAPGGAA